MFAECAVGNEVSVVFQGDQIELDFLAQPCVALLFLERTKQRMRFKFLSINFRLKRDAGFFPFVVLRLVRLLDLFPQAGLHLFDETFEVACAMLQRIDKKADQG